MNKDREEVSAKTFMDAMNGHPVNTPSTGKMKVHIEIEKAERDGSLSITADIDNQQDTQQYLSQMVKQENMMRASTIEFRGDHG